MWLQKSYWASNHARIYSDGGLFKKLPILNILNPERSSCIYPIKALPFFQNSVEKLNV